MNDEGAQIVYDYFRLIALKFATESIMISQIVNRVYFTFHSYSCHFHLLA